MAIKPHNTKRGWRTVGGSSILHLNHPKQSDLLKETPDIRFKGATHEDRVRHVVIKCSKIRDARQVEAVIKEFPHVLMDMDRKRIGTKVLICTEMEAKIRNKSVSDMGLQWCRSGY